MKTAKEPQRAWLYERVPGNYVETKNTLSVLMLQAQRDGRIALLVATGSYVAAGTPIARIG